MENLTITDLYKKLILSDEELSPKITTVGSALEINNIISRSLYLAEDITDDNATAINSMIRFWNDLDNNNNIPKEKRQPIKIYVNSYGGSLMAGFSIIDSIKLSCTPIYTINIAKAYSAAFEIFITGHKRITYPKSSFLFHEGSAEMSGDANKFRNYAEFYSILLKKAKQHILENTQITEEEYSKHQKDDWWITAEDALKYGICDEIAKGLI